MLENMRTQLRIINKKGDTLSIIITAEAIDKRRLDHEMREFFLSLIADCSEFQRELNGDKGSL